MKVNKPIFSFPYHSYSLSEDIDFRMYPLNYIGIIQWPMTYGREGKWDFNCLVNIDHCRIYLGNKTDVKKQVLNQKTIEYKRQWAGGGDR